MQVLEEVLQALDQIKLLDPCLMYTLSPLACGPHAPGVYISKIPHNCGITITYMDFLHSSNVIVFKNIQAGALETHCKYSFLVLYLVAQYFEPLFV